MCTGCGAVRSGAVCKEDGLAAGAALWVQPEGLAPAGRPASPEGLTCSFPVPLVWAFALAPRLLGRDPFSSIWWAWGAALVAELLVTEKLEKPEAILGGQHPRPRCHGGGSAASGLWEL